MKHKLKSLISTFCLAFMMLPSCAITDAGNTSSAVTIQSITLSEDDIGARGLQPKRLDGESSDELETSVEGGVTTSEKTQEGDIQYIVIYKSLQEISLTIKLDNPEAKSIDAIRLKCDDPESKIQIDGEYKPLVKEADGTRVVNWASEDAYEKTYKIQLQSEEYLNTLMVTDIRLSGHEKFQSKETNVKSLGRNELKIYKMEDTDFQHIFYTNTPEYYKESLIISDNVHNLRVTGAGSSIENGYLTVTENGSYTIEYDYYFNNGFIAPIKIENEIELLKLSYKFDENSPEGGLLSDPFNLGLFLSGTMSENAYQIGLYKEHPETKEKIYMFALGVNYEFGFMPDPASTDIVLLLDELNNTRLEGYTNIYLKIFENYYLINFEASVLELVE